MSQITAERTTGEEHTKGDVTEMLCFLRRGFYSHSNIYRRRLLTSGKCFEEYIFFQILENLQNTQLCILNELSIYQPFPGRRQSEMECAVL